MDVAAVSVEFRNHDWAPRPATRAGRVLLRDEQYHRHAGGRRYFWLLDEGVQMVYEPFGWRDEWYIDIVEIERSPGEPECYRITDEHIDLVVQGMGPTYRIIDLDELGDAMLAGRMPETRAANALARTQRFVDRYLHRGAPFPPPAIRPYFAADHRYPPVLSS